MAAKRLKPDVGDMIAHVVITQDIEIKGEVIDLLDTQFTVRIHYPKRLANRTVFIFYNDDYTIE